MSLKIFTGNRIARINRRNFDCDVPTLTYLSMLQVNGDAAFGNSLWLSLGLAGAGIMTVAPLLFLMDQQCAYR